LNAAWLNPWLYRHFWSEDATEFHSGALGQQMIAMTSDILVDYQKKFSKKFSSNRKDCDPWYLV